MSHLYLPWGSGERYTNRLQVRNQFASSLELHKQSSYEYQEPIQRQRSPSLPPIHNIELNKSLEDRRSKEVLNRNLSSAKRFAFYDEDAEGDTSGYGSETLNIKNQCESFHGLPLNHRNNNVVAWQENGKDNRYFILPIRHGNNLYLWVYEILVLVIGSHLLVVYQSQ